MDQDVTVSSSTLDLLRFHASSSVKNILAIYRSSKKLSWRWIFSRRKLHNREIMQRAMDLLFLVMFITSTTMLSHCYVFEVFGSLWYLLTNISALLLSSVGTKDLYRLQQIKDDIHSLYGFLLLLHCHSISSLGWGLRENKERNELVKQKFLPWLMAW